MSSAYPIFQVVKVCRQVKLICCIDLRNQLTGNQFETLSLRNECQSIFGNEEKTHTHTHISNKHFEWHPGEFIGISQTIAIFVVEAVEDTIFHTWYRKGELKLSCIRKRSAITIRKLTLAQKSILRSIANSFHLDPCMVYLPAFTIRIKHKT